MNVFQRFKTAWEALDAHINSAQWDLLQGETPDAKAWQETGHRLTDEVRHAERDLILAIGGRPLTDGASAMQDDDDYDDTDLISLLCW